MTRILLMTPLAFTLALASGAAAVEAGSEAPDFTLTATDGAEVTLSEYRGKTVVLEWFNPDCPFVKYAHGDDGPLKDMVDQAQAEGVVWLAINSGAKGKQGHGLERNTRAREEYGMAYPVLLDEDGSVGRSYDAKTTPHMYVITPDGTVAYAGALDSAPLGKGGSKDGYANYLSDALEAVSGQRTVETAETKAYGCSVKYGG